MTEEQQGPPKGASSRKKSARKRTILFVVFFVLITLGLLTSYHLAKTSAVNDWYLFQVAKNTSWVLDKIGESSEASHGVKGPHVQFVMRKGLNMDRHKLELDLRELRKNTEMEAPEKKKQIAELNTELQALKKQIKELRGKEGSEKQIRGYVFSFTIIPECGAIEVMVIFFAAVVSFPARWSKRAWGVLLGVPIMYGVNIFRLSSLGVIGARYGGGEVFDFIHEYVWQTIYIIFVVIIWLLWVELVVKRRT
jgi:exosortase/archaeosortase family protein